MPIQFQCLSCQSTLRVPDFLAGRKVKCPKCGGVADVGLASDGAASLAPSVPGTGAEEGLRPLPESEQVHIRVRQPPPLLEPDVEDAEIVEDPPSPPVRSKSRREEAISTRPVRRNESTQPDDDEDDGEVEKASRPRSFKRRKRRRPIRKSTTPRSYRWVGWAVAGVFYLVVATSLIVHMVVTGHTTELILHGVEWALLMPVALVIFVASMFISSAIGGGIDFGDFRLAIPKALFLLAPVNLINVLLFGWVGFIFTLPVLVIGVILLFGLDPWEAKFVVIINWILTRGALFLTNLIAALIIRGPVNIDKVRNSPDDFGDEQMEAPMQKAPPNLKGRLGR